MAFIPGQDMQFDTWLTGAGILYYDENAWWRDILTILPGALEGKFPYYDPLMDAFKDQRAGLKLIGDAVPRSLEFKSKLMPYTIEPYAATTFISEMDILQSIAMRNPLPPDVAAMYGIIQTFNTAAGCDLADLLLTRSNWSNYHSPATLFTTDTCYPFKEFMKAKAKVSLASGGTRKVTDVVMGEYAWNAFINNVNVQKYVRYTLNEPKKIISALQGLLEIPNWHIVSAAKNTVGTTDDATSPTMEFMFGADIWMGYIERNPSPKSPSALYGLALTNQLDIVNPTSGAPIQGYGLTVTSIEKMGQSTFEDMRKGKKIRVDLNINPKVIAPQLGYLMQNVITVADFTNA